MVITILVSIGFYISGIVLLLISYRLRRHANHFLATSVEVLGTVVCMEQMRVVVQPESGITFTPLVSYKDQEGRLYTVRRSWSTFPSPCNVGAAWPVYYQVANPQNAKLGPRREIFRSALNCFIASVILLVFGTLILLIHL
jgi:Protein of unknown function (DUF3592)